MNLYKILRSLLLACIVISLAACANTPTQPTGLAAETARPTAAVPGELSPATPSDTFNQLQAKIAKSDGFTLMQDGTLKYQAKDGMKTVSSLTVDPTTGQCMFSGGAAIAECDPNSITLGKSGAVTLTLLDGTVMTTVDGVHWDKIDPNAIANSLETGVGVSFKNMETVPVTTFEYLYSDAYKQKVMERDAAGVYPAFPDTAVVPVGGIKLVDTSTAFFKKYGVDSMFIPNLTQSEADLWRKSMQNRSYQPVEKAKILLLDGTYVYYTLIEELNMDKSHGFFGLIDGDGLKDTDPAAVAMRMVINVDLGDPGRIVGGNFYQKGSCIKYDRPDMCKYVEGAIPQVIVNWAKKGGTLNNKITVNGKPQIEIPIFHLSSSMVDRSIVN